MNSGKKILVVDDSALQRRIIKMELEESGYVVSEASNGIEALEEVMASPPDLVTLDMEMPKLNGMDTCRKLFDEEYVHHYTHLEDKRVPVIFVTANDNLRDRKTGFDLGATDFITKPFAKGEISEAVSKVLHPGKRLENMTALVVDDNLTARSVVKIILDREGVTVIEAEDGITAYEIMCNRMAEVDILVTDLFMPRMNGDDLCIKIRKELNLKDLPIIFLTAMSEQSELLDLFKCGGTDYIVKPFVKEELLSRINVHLERAALSSRLRASVNELTGLNVMKDNLLSVCSHDLRTPLNSILGFSEMMLLKSDLTNEDRESLTDIKVSGELLLDLVNDLLDLSKIRSEEVFETEETDVFKLAEISYNAMRHLVTIKKQQLILKDKAEDHHISVNKSGIIRVINNLLSNAIKFTPEKGKITLIVDAAYSKGYMTFSISDTGIGIPEERIPSIFERFTFTSQPGTGGEPGTGLGMAIVKEIVEKHGGHVEVQSREGVGTTVRFFIPMASDSRKAASPSLVEPASTSTHRRELKILLVEDNHMNVKIAKKILSGCGHRVKAVSNGILAIKEVRAERFDVILMDLNMPEMGGVEATKAIRSAGILNTPIIALTANTGMENIDKCLDAGMNDYLSKPIKPGELKEKLDIWCCG